MVFQTLALMVRSKGPDTFWRKRKILKLSAHFVDRRRNCYALAIRNVLRALAFATKGRKWKKQDMAELWQTRVEAGSEQHGVPYRQLREGLNRSNILLNRKSLADLAIWEPSSFKALTQIAWTRMRLEGDPQAREIDAEPPKNVFVKIPGSKEQ